MRRHTFEPGKLTAGLVVLATTAVWALDAADRWHVSSVVVLPVVPVGLCVAGLVSAVAYRIRRRRERGDP
ncbi:hypothetical protein RKE29_18300 [Streptomyces sp. B1866]|uniref:hypothetical protein n=1 Tax=Streptomyces sp. B1866 TaxID=3075431 RepID=UPI00288E2813|nr:hypothetical protein [Streptomyces sp. B1866]MDT3398575.1 hypothetical protein [Streptomyces sp. B1866]